MVIAGANGFLGQVLCEYFVSRKWKVIALTRNLQADAPGIHYVQWDGSHLGPWAQSLEGARALINLAGRSVNCRYHAANRKRILSSRVVSTRLLGEAISHCKHPPQVWLNASTGDDLPAFIRQTAR